MIKSFIIGTIFLISIIVILIYIKFRNYSGEYECISCKNKWNISLKQIIFAPYSDEIVYTKCPICNEKNWNKKSKNN